MPRRSIFNEPDSATDIDLSPMIDCIFILLIFFVVTTVFVEEPGVEISRPDAQLDADLEKNSIIIAITADNRIYFDGAEIRVDQVAPLMKQAAFGRSPALIIRGDRVSDLGVFAQVYTEAKKAGIPHVQFATTRSDTP